MDEHEDVAQVREWVSRLDDFIAALGDIAGDDPFDFCENAMDAWKDGVSPDTAPPPTSPAMMIILETFRALAQVMTSATVDYYTTPDVRDRITRESAQGSLTDALDGVRRDARRWLAEGLPSLEEIKQRTADVGASMKSALEVNAKIAADEDADDAAAAADPYGAVLGYRDPNLDVAIIFTKVCSFSEDENNRYRDAHERIRRMLDSELLRHISDASDRFCDVLIGVLSDLRDNRMFGGIQGEHAGVGFRR
ncbi:hypothetical protein BST45_19575 [Mycobacterium shinjukuense]|nr:hypothetical protein BST45_19575 [Mycobacterium shinjukuense]